MALMPALDELEPRDGAPNISERGLWCGVAQYVAKTFRRATLCHHGAHLIYAP